MFQENAHLVCLAGACILAGSLSGCVTTEQVEAIVESSNASVLSLVESSNASLDTLVANADRDAIDAVSTDATLLPEGSDGDDAWLASVERIDRFIADHPQAQVVNNTLRIRQASILMMAKQLNLAAAVFDEVNPDIALNPRDRAVYDAREPLLFWYNLSGSLDRSQANAIPGHLATLAGVADGLPADLAARRYLEQVRVRMALRLGRSITRAQPLIDVLEAPLARYGDTFDGARDTVLAWHTDSLDGSAAVSQLASLRWYDYVPCAYERANRLLAETCGLEAQLGETPPAACASSFTPDWLASVDATGCAD
ncbi:MAG: hypothetical protein AAGA68_13365 [Pseudomonadota bacterium]